MHHHHRLAFGVVSACFALSVLASACSQTTETVASTTTETTAPPETTTTAEVPMMFGKQISVYTPEVGDCWDKRKPDVTKPDEIILKLDCKLPHSYENFGVIDAVTKEFPGDPILKAQATKECPKLFKAYVGAPYETSKWEIGYHFPTAAGWEKTTRHAIACYLYDKATGRKLEGSKKGTAD